MQQSVQRNADYCNKYFSNLENIFTDAKRCYDMLHPPPFDEYRRSIDTDILWDPDSSSGIHKYKDDKKYTDLITDTAVFWDSININKKNILLALSIVNNAVGDVNNAVNENNIDNAKNAYKKSNAATAFLKENGKSLYKIQYRVNQFCDGQFNDDSIYMNQCLSIKKSLFEMQNI